MGRFINADAFATNGQGLLGNNMFVYCNNNPVNYDDQAGQSPATVIRCIISATSSVVCDLIAQKSVGEIFLNATVAVVGTIFAPLGALVTICNAVDTTVSVTQTTGDIFFGLFMGGLTIGASLCTGENIGKIPGVENFDEAAELFLDATLGLSANIILSKSSYDYTEGYTSNNSNLMPASTSSGNSSGCYSRTNSLHTAMIAY